MKNYKIYYQQHNKLCKITLRANDENKLKENKLYPQNVIQIVEKNFLKNIKNYFSFYNESKQTLQLFKQLKTMLDANLTFNDALALLLNQQQNKHTQKLLGFIQFSLQNNHKLSKVLQHNKLLDDTSIMFLELGIENGNIKDAVESLVTIKEEITVAKKKLQETLKYPLILFITLLAALVLIVSFVLPNFEFMFSNMQHKLPLATQMLLTLKHFVSQNFIVLVFSHLIVVFCFILLLKKFKYQFDKVFLKYIPVVTKVYKYYLFYRLFLSISIIVKAKYKFQTALFHTQNIDNLYMEKKLKKITQDIHQGKSIPESFISSKLFDPLTCELLYTAEHANNYEKVLQDISLLYKQQLGDSIKSFTSWIEPAMILFISLVVLWLILAVMVPVWDFSASL